jgi:hypothetical protein
MKIVALFRRIFMRGPIVPLLQREIHAIDKMETLIRRHEPRLLPAFRALRSEPTSHMGAWLDENFPVEGGWGQRVCADGASDLSAYFEGRR